MNSNREATSGWCWSPRLCASLSGLPALFPLLLPVPPLASLILVCVGNRRLDETRYFVLVVCYAGLLLSPSCVPLRPPRLSSLALSVSPQTSRSRACQWPPTRIPMRRPAARAWCGRSADRSRRALGRRAQLQRIAPLAARVARTASRVTPRRASRRVRWWATASLPPVSCMRGLGPGPLR